jgi:site-specific recombinase XerD
MLTIYRRHTKSCPHKEKGRKYRRCKCPIWVDGLVAGKDERKTTGLKDWEKAQKRVREWEDSGQEPKQDPGPVTLSQAWADFMQDAKGRELQEPTLYKYSLLRRQMEAFSGARGIRFLREFDLPVCREFRASWKQRNLSAQKTLERLRAFFRFCQDAGWVNENPARKVKNPRITDRPKEPFTQGEMAEILAACGRYQQQYRGASREHSLRLRALILLLRYSGLRIGDAVTLARERLQGSRLELYTAKTGTKVYCSLPGPVVSALECTPLRGRYFFWSGEGKPKSAVGDWQRTLRNLFEIAGVKGGHAHRFRNTFAVENLQAGVPIEDVAILLGHRSVRVTEKHYAPWVKSRQERLDQRVRQAWANDAWLKGTREVHGESGVVN